jgi:hypothetical protein
VRWWEGVVSTVWIESLRDRPPKSSWITGRKLALRSCFAGGPHAYLFDIILPTHERHTFRRCNVLSLKAKEHLRLMLIENNDEPRTTTSLSVFESLSYDLPSLVLLYPISTTESDSDTLANRQ